MRNKIQILHGKIQKFCNNNDDNLNKKDNTVLCTLHLMSDAFGTYKKFLKIIIVSIIIIIIIIIITNEKPLKKNSSTANKCNSQW